MSKLSEAKPHSAVLLLPTSAGVILALPPASSCTVMFSQTATGGAQQKLLGSATVTLAVQASDSPLDWEVTVRVMSYVLPTSSQLNSVMEAEKSTEPQVAEEPASKKEAATVVIPSLVRLTVGLLHTAVGGLLSSTVTVALQLLELPLGSMAVSLTVLAPMSSQSKLLTSRLRLLTAQLSVLPPSICPGVIVLWPD